MSRIPRSFSLADRAAGVLLHLTSLPTSPYTGDLGTSAHAFVDWLAAAKQRWWQMLPVNPIGDGDSPYSTTSSFAGEALLIDPEAFVKAGWLKRRDLSGTRPAARRTDYAASRRWRGALLRAAFARAAAGLNRSARFQTFRTQERAWLEDYALYVALAERYRTRDWSTWPRDIKTREPASLRAARDALAPTIRYLEFQQYLFQCQWDELKKHANRQGIGLIGDLPIFVSHGSADVWAYARQFRLDAQGKPTVVAGCPPDAFNKDGQLWGNALYDWGVMKRDGFKWWLARLHRMLRLFDAVRLDHFIGFYRYWEIKAGAKTARGGRWIRAEGDALFAAVKRRLGNAQFIAEDLGAVTPEVRALRDKYGFPGMKVLQFGFDGTNEAEHHKPHLLVPNSVVYTGTHDNNTTRGWINDLSKRAKRDPKARRERDLVLHYLGATPATVAPLLARAAYMSSAKVAVLPLQDLLGQDQSARMNIPGVAKGNWRYRALARDLTGDLAASLKTLTVAYDR